MYGIATYMYVAPVKDIYLYGYFKFYQKLLVLYACTLAKYQTHIQDHVHAFKLHAKYSSQRPTLIFITSDSS